ncbi:hypothetical protein ACFWZT_34125 [Streptomyces alboflavus]
MSEWQHGHRDGAARPHPWRSASPGRSRYGTAVRAALVERPTLATASL